MKISSGVWLIGGVAAAWILYSSFWKPAKAVYDTFNKTETATKTGNNLLSAFGQTEEEFFKVKNEPSDFITGIKKLFSGQLFTTQTPTAKLKPATTYTYNDSNATTAAKTYLDYQQNTLQSVLRPSNSTVSTLPTGWDAPAPADKQLKTQSDIKPGVASGSGGVTSYVASKDSKTGVGYGNNPNLTFYRENGKLYADTGNIKNLKSSTGKKK